jgi:hypothetical protein
MPNRQRIFLNHYDNTIVGKYSHDAETVHIVLDSEITEFSVELPPLGNNEKTDFIFYNLPEYGDGNDVTITGRSINKIETSLTIQPFETASFVDSLKGYWLQQ